MCPHVQWLAWQLTEGGGRIVGGLVAIGGNALGDGSTVAGDRLAVDAGLIGVNVGISPKAPPASSVGASRQNLRQRLRQRYALNAYGSTLRLTLGCLLAEGLGLVLRRVGSGTRLTFADGEARLSQWMVDNAFVCWVAHQRPWELEDTLVKLSTCR